MIGEIVGVKMGSYKLEGFFTGRKTSGIKSDRVVCGVLVGGMLGETVGVKMGSSVESETVLSSVLSNVDEVNASIILGASLGISLCIPFDD